MYIVGKDFFDKGMKKPEMARPNRALQVIISAEVLFFSG